MTPTRDDGAPVQSRGKGTSSETSVRRRVNNKKEEEDGGGHVGTDKLHEQGGEK